MSYPHSHSHSHILRLDRRPHTRLTTTTTPFDLTHFLLPISRCALHLVPPTDSLPIPIAPPPLVLHLVLRFCGHRAQCSQPLMSFVLLFIVRLSHLSLNTADQHFSLTASVFICTIICLAIAAHFQSVLSASDLSKPCMHDRYRLLNTEPSWQLVLYHSQSSYPRQPLPSFSYCAVLRISTCLER